MDQHKKIRKKNASIIKKINYCTNLQTNGCLAWWFSPKGKGVGIFGSSSTLVTQGNGENTNKVSSL